MLTRCHMHQFLLSCLHCSLFRAHRAFVQVAPQLISAPLWLVPAVGGLVCFQHTSHPSRPQPAARIPIAHAKRSGRRADARTNRIYIFCCCQSFRAMDISRPFQVFQMCKFQQACFSDLARHVYSLLIVPAPFCVCLHQFA